jgi:hypothetical protein
VRCSFEETVELLMDAAGAGETDNCKGISEKSSLGRSRRYSPTSPSYSPTIPSFSPK